MNAGHAERMGRLIDRRMYGTDAQYHAEVERFRRMFEMFDMAMRQEDIESDVVDRVLNRLLFGMPSGADAYERIQFRKEQMELLMLGKGKFFR